MCMDVIRTFFGRTDLRIRASRAKNCKQVDGEVRFSLEAPKPAQKREKRFPRPINLGEQKKKLAENWIDGDRLKRVLAKSRADRSHV